MFSSLFGNIMMEIKKISIQTNVHIHINPCKYLHDTFMLTKHFVITFENPLALMKSTCY